MTGLVKCCVLQGQFYRHVHTLVNDERMLDHNTSCGEFERLSELCLGVVGIVVFHDVVRDLPHKVVSLRNQFNRHAHVLVGDEQMVAPKQHYIVAIDVHSWPHRVFSLQRRLHRHAGALVNDNQTVRYKYRNIDVVASLATRYVLLWRCEGPSTRRTPRQCTWAWR